MTIASHLDKQRDTQVGKYLVMQIKKKRSTEVCNCRNHHQPIFQLHKMSPIKERWYQTEINCIAFPPSHAQFPSIPPLFSLYLPTTTYLHPNFMHRNFLPVLSTFSLVPTFYLLFSFIFLLLPFLLHLGAI